MSDETKPIRRVVTGNDAHGRSCVLYDSAAPNVKAGGGLRLRQAAANLELTLFAALAMSAATASGFEI